MSSTSLTRIRSVGNMGPLDGKPERRVLVIYTGGTIGMIRNENGVLEPLPNMLTKKIRAYPQLHDVEYATRRFGDSDGHNELVLPDSSEMCRIVYVILEYDVLLDSSNMTMSDWSSIAQDICWCYEKYDGFVVLHGTDTLTYTASALSFMLENLGKTVIVTGSQIPIFEARSDGRDNLFSSLLIAGNYVIPEVLVYFSNKVYRGNRTVKVSTDNFNAFDSPNFPPIATVGINVDVNYKNIFRPRNTEKFCVQKPLNENVGLLRIFPGITSAMVKTVLQPPIQGIVLQSYGSGNFPSNRQDLTELLREAARRNVIIVNCTQCSQGSVQELYATGKMLNELGIIPGADMTPEAALTKLAYVLSKSEWDLETKRKVLMTNLRGELTSNKFSTLENWDLVDLVANCLQINSPQKVTELSSVLLPALLLSAVQDNDIDQVKTLLKQYKCDPAVSNFDRRTALHIACAEGHHSIVQYLVKKGANVHVRDRFDKTPLNEAICSDQHEIIRFLVKCGAHLRGSLRLVGEELCQAAARASVVRLESYRLAGVELNQQDSCGRTAMHVAVLLGHSEVIQYLLNQNYDFDIADFCGLTPLDLARKKELDDIVELLQNDSQNNGKVNGHASANGYN